MSYKHLATFERARIETFNILTYSTRNIANSIGRHHSTVARELSRNLFNYEAEKSQTNYRLRRENAKPKGNYSKELADEIQSLLLQTWSPEQISNTINSKISFKTIYNWLYLEMLSKVDLNVLSRKGKTRKPLDIRGKFLVATSIRKKVSLYKKEKNSGIWN